MKDISPEPMRIIAGKWRGRPIVVPKGLHVRPTMDRIRESWMNILQHKIPGAKVLDLYAGSGALGMEALSRGASFADFVEKNPDTVTKIRMTIEGLQAQDCTAVHNTDVESFVSKLGLEAYDVAFADPPYNIGAARKLAEMWKEKPFARLIGIEHAREEEMPSWTDGGGTRQYGIRRITFYEIKD